MDAIVESEHVATKILPEKVSVNQINSILDHCDEHITILSLDCFDTLLWRTAAVPSDVFYDMQQSPPFQSANISAIQRVTAEALSRQAMFIQTGSYEIKLKDIYRIGFPALSPDQVDALVQGEIQAEIDTCYALPAIVKLIRAAHERGMQVIIVSNTYLEEMQLRSLLTSALPADVMTAIARIYCSCEYGVTKNGGLFARVLQELNVSAQAMLHIGDNRGADFVAPRAYGIHAAHFIQYDKIYIDQLRMQANAATFAHAAIRHTRGLASPFRGVIGSSSIPIVQPETVIGYLSMGPIMYAFARLICDDIEKMKQAGTQPKVLYLLRDGYLPALACTVLAGESIGNSVRISRYTATAASFRCKQDVEHYLAETISTLPFDYICHQLLLPQETTTTLLKLVHQHKNPAHEFSQFILQNDTLDYIYQQSTEYRARLKSYLQQEANIMPGDTVLFVDIGYAGTTQQHLTPILKDELGVKDVFGYYLLTLNTANWHKLRCGLIDPSWCDDRTIGMLGASFALIEELCCSGGESVVDYDASGNAIGSKSLINDAQKYKISHIQAECIRFIKEAKDFFQAANITISIPRLRDIALAELCRRIYLPAKIEIEYLQDFQHDRNRGGNEVFRIFNDPEDEVARLHKQGLSFSGQHPFVLRHIGLNLAFTVMTQRRFGLEIKTDDLSLRQEWISILLCKDNKSTQHSLSAVPTHDGFYAIRIPIENAKMQVAILFGHKYKMIQIKCAEFIKAKAFQTGAETKNAEDVTDKLVLNQMVDKGHKLFECASTSSALLASMAFNSSDNQPVIFRVVYRPIA